MIYRESRGVKSRYNKRKREIITDEEALTLAEWGCIIEEHYQSPQDIEWAKDGKTGNYLLFNQDLKQCIH